MLHANITALGLIEWELLPIEVLHCVGIGIFYLFGSRDLDLDPMIFIYKFDTYITVEIYRMCKYELPTSRFSKVIV